MDATGQPTGAAVALLALYVVVALSVSALCSLLEAALLSTREADLDARASEGDRGAALLSFIKRERVDDAISAILTLNTIAHTVGAAMAGAQAAVVFGDAWVGLFSGVLTLLILVFTEIIPKTLGTVHASRLAGFVGRTVWLLVRALTPVLHATRKITRLLVRGGAAAPIAPGEIVALAAAAARRGTVHRDVTRTVSNLLRLDAVRAYDVMTPRTVVWMLPIEASARDLLDDPQHRVFSRLPLYRSSPDRIEGYALVREVLADAARSGRRDLPLAAYLRRARVVPETARLGELLRRMIDSRDHLAVVVDEFGGTSGIVSMEDIVETLLGREILDELDQTPDLRRAAAQIRDQRLRRQQPSEPEPTR